MQTTLIILAVLILAGMVGGVWLINSKMRVLLEPKEEKKDDQSLLMLQNQLNKISEDLRKGLTQSNESTTKQFQASARIIREVTEKLTKLDETNKQVVNFAEQMHSLEGILKNPKQRGILGEYFLEALLGNVLQPGQFKMQYTFADGEIVDAAVFYRDQIIPIDAKFSLEKFNAMVDEKNKDKMQVLEREFAGHLKDRINETAKYIRPSEGTTEFAFMFLPAEGVYYKLLGEQVGRSSVIEYAFKKRVIIVSPTSFFAYLETVLQGLQALKMEEGLKGVIKRVGELSRHLEVHEESLIKLGKHLGTSVNMYNHTYKELGKIDKDVLKITDGEVGGKVGSAHLEQPVMDIG